MKTPAHRNLKPHWRITVLSADGQRMIFHAACEDRKECACLATETRSHSLTYQIWLSPPWDAPAEPWD
jgi:hypothetical protein